MARGFKPTRERPRDDLFAAMPPLEAKKWIYRVQKDDDGREFVRCRLVARGFKPTREGPRDDLFAVMPPLDAKKALFAYVPGCARRDENRARTRTSTRNTMRDNGSSCRTAASAGRSAEAERQRQNGAAGTQRWQQKAAARAANWMRSRCQMKLRSMTRNNKMETKCGVDARML